MFTQRNCLTTHFSENIPVVKWRNTVHHSSSSRYTISRRDKLERTSCTYLCRHWWILQGDYSWLFYLLPKMHPFFSYQDAFLWLNHWNSTCITSISTMEWKWIWNCPFPPALFQPCRAPCPPRPDTPDSHVCREQHLFPVWGQPQMCRTAMLTVWGVVHPLTWASHSILVHPGWQIWKSA